MTSGHNFYILHLRPESTVRRTCLLAIHFYLFIKSIVLIAFAVLLIEDALSRNHIIEHVQRKASRPWLQRFT